MEHPALREIVQALEAMGVKFQGEFAHRPCQACKRHRRWRVNEIAHKRVLNLVFCNACLSLQKLATTNRSEILIA